jgi:serine protease Do
MSFLRLAKQQKLLSFTLLLFTLSIGILIGTLLNTDVKAAREQTAAPDATPLVVASPRALSNEFTKLAKLLEPSVVYITTDYTPKPERQARKGRPQQQTEPEDEDGLEAFRRFFRSPGGGGGLEVQPKQQFKREASGSGVIVDKNGYILTNNHVIEQADHIRVKMHGDPKEYKAKLIGTDVETDLAIIKIDAGKGLVPAKIGNSEAVQVGDWAVAIGSPFGLEATVTAGIISALGRDVPGSQQFQRFLQTDAAINPGNSGGPLLNIEGEVIGINTAIATQSGGYQGVGFAMPVNTAVKVYNAVIKTGKVTRGSIGIGWQKYQKNPEVLKAMGANSGVLVDQVEPGGPSEKGGIKRDDIVVAINGKKVKDGDELVQIVADLTIGSDATVTVDRGGKMLDKKVTIKDREEVFANDPRINRSKPTSSETKPEGTQVRFGISIRSLTEAEKEGLSGDVNGVLVTRVEEGSFADEITIQERDVLVSINRVAVTTIEDIKKIQATLKPGDAVAFRVMRPSPARTGKSQYASFLLSGTLPTE